MKATTTHRFRNGAFTLVELLVVISIIGVLAGMTVAGMGVVKKNRVLSVAKGELAQLQTALENYKAKYGVYPPGNQIPGTPTYAPALFNQLYYELSGTTLSGGNFTSLDGSSTISQPGANTAFGVGGFVNCSKGGGEDAASAKNFLLNLSSKQLERYATNNSVRTTMIITAVGGPDDNYFPLGAGSSGINPYRYVYPGTNNVGGYDLWVQLQYKNEKYLICNWNKAVLKNQNQYP
jgi:prepilin-type N-terminal cleavage/methylation domain-containing protein